MRELIRAMAQLEDALLERYQVSPNEAMALCCIAADTLTAKTISDNIGLTASNTSKVLRALEDKRLIERKLGEVDRRQMYFSLTPEGISRLAMLKTEEIPIPTFIRPLFQ